MTQASVKNQKQKSLRILYIPLWGDVLQKYFLSESCFLKRRIQSSSIKDVIWMVSWRRKLSNLKEVLKVLVLQCSISGPASLSKKLHSNVLRVNLDTEIKLKLFSGKYRPLLMFQLSQVSRVIFPFCRPLDPQKSTVSFAMVDGNF